MKKIIALLLFAGVLGGGGYFLKEKIGPSNNLSKSSDYNVIIFAFDGLQAKHLDKFGYPLHTTPNLDAFLDRSYLFKNTVSPSSWTVPSFMSIFTSMYPSDHKVVNKFVEYSQVGTSTKAVKANLKQLSPNATTLAEVLKNNGYKTAGFTGDAGISAAFGHAQGFDTYFDKEMFGGFETSIPMAEDWLKQNKDSKFFLFVHGYDVHGQHAPKEGFDYRYVQKPYTGSYTGSIQEQGALREQSLANGGLSLSDEDKAFWRAIYDEKINRADVEFGDFMKYVDGLDLSKKTIIITISDHGTEFFEHGGIDHGHTLYNELLNTLFAIRLPGEEKGKEVNSLVSTLDLAPTVLKILNIKDAKMSAQEKGIDLTPSFNGKDVSRDIYSETDYRLYTHKRSIETPDGWKLILTMENGGKELYNIKNDPNETQNLIDKEPKIAYDLEKKIYAHLNAMNANGPWPIGCLPVYNDQCQTLKAATSTSFNFKEPNIFLINIDSLRADHMGIYGYKKNTTPFLDSLAEKGTVFQNAIIPDVYTFQTDAAIFSGLYPSQNNVTGWQTPIRDNLTLLPKYLKSYGYKTAAFVSPSLWEKFGFAKQFDLYKLNQNMKNVAESSVDVSNWAKEQKKPFFVFWHIYDVHLPFGFEDKSLMDTNYDGVFSQPKRWIWEGQSTTSIPVRGNGASVSVDGYDPVTEKDVAYLKGKYDSGIKHVDEELKKFFDRVSSEPYFQNSIFIISSEHGEDLKEHGFIFHRDLYDVNARVPLIIYSPKLTRNNIKEAVSSLDIFPTVMDLVGGAVPKSLEGRSLTGLMKGESMQRDIFAERVPFGEYSVRRANWKYIMRNPKKLENIGLYDEFMQRVVKNDVTSTDELYNLSIDPMEKNNLLGQGIPVEKELREVLENFKQRMVSAKENNKNIKEFSPQGGKFIPYP